MLAIQDALLDKGKYFHIECASQRVEFRRMARHTLHSHIDKGCGSEHRGHMTQCLLITTPDAIIFRHNELDRNSHVRRNLWKTRAPFLCFFELWHGTRDIPFWVQLRQFLWIG